MARTIRVVPAILTDNTDTLKNLIRQTETFTDYAQFDLMDGQFVPSHSFTPTDLTNLKINLNWEAHLMMLQPEDCRGGGMERNLIDQRPGDAGRYGGQPGNAYRRI
jgi:pentose-5-phosphate-3-epimerase